MRSTLEDFFEEYNYCTGETIDRFYKELLGGIQQRFKDDNVISSNTEVALRYRGTFHGTGSTIISVSSPRIKIHEILQIAPSIAREVKSKLPEPDLYDRKMFESQQMERFASHFNVLTLEVGTLKKLPIFPFPIFDLISYARFYYSVQESENILDNTVYLFKGFVLKPLRYRERNEIDTNNFIY